MAYTGETKLRAQTGFTLLEVMIAVGVIGIAMLALVALHDSNLMGVVRGQELSQAAALAQGLMTETELQRFPFVGTTSGDFNQMYPGRVYAAFRWQRDVIGGAFPDLRQVRITVFYGPRFTQSFSIVEFVHDPTPQQFAPNAQPSGNPAAQPSSDALQ